VERIFSANAPQAYTLMRIMIGLLFLCHGAQKALGFFGGVNGEDAVFFLFRLSLHGDPKCRHLDRRYPRSKGPRCLMNMSFGVERFKPLERFERLEL
jgi:hypothetical protein